MSAQSPFAAFKVITFDVVGTLIDFETGMLDYLRKSGAADASISDGMILDVYRVARGAEKTEKFPDDLERCYGELVHHAGLKPGVAFAQGFRDSAEFWPAFPELGRGAEAVGDTLSPRRYDQRPALGARSFRPDTR